MQPVLVFGVGVVGGRAADGAAGGFVFRDEGWP